MLSNSSQKNIKETGVTEEVILPKLSKLNLWLVNKKQNGSITAFSRRKKTLEKTRRQCSGS